MHNWFKHLLIWLMWIGLALLSGLIAAAVQNTHGSIGLIFFAIPVGLLGALATSVLFGSRQRFIHGHFRQIILLTAVSSSPIAAMAAYAFSSKSNYSATDAFMFYWPFGLGALFLSAIASIIFLRKLKNVAIK